MPMIDRSLVRKILVIKLRAVGDVLLSTIVSKNLREAFPDAVIEYLTEPPSVDILKGNPFIDGTIVYDRKTISGMQLIRRVRARGYHLVIDLFGNPRTALVSRLSGARYRVGFRFRGRTYAYTIVVEPRGGQVHNTQFNLDALEAIGVPVVDRSVHFRYSTDDAHYVNEFLAMAFPEGRRLIALNSGGGWYTKRWPFEKFSAVADRLHIRYGAGIVLTWGPGQYQDVEAIRSQMKSEAFIPPATTLPQLGALLHRCSMVVTNDSGPMHIAAAVGTPVLGIYGPTSPVLQGPYGNNHVIVREEGLDCLGCNLTACPIGHPCMRDLTVEAVLDGAERLIAGNNISF